jgi:hypothetical protein
MTPGSELRVPSCPFWFHTSKISISKKDTKFHEANLFGIIFSMVLLNNRALSLPILLFACMAAHAAETGATVSFTLDFQGANPSHYEITVASDGRGSYTSNGQLDQRSEPADPAPLQFTISESVRSQIFDLAKKARYFSGKIDSGRKNIANTGNKVFTYKDANHNSSATYNYSSVPAVQDLTAIFQGLSTTLEFGRRLAFFRKYEKLALDDDLKRMEQMQRENNLGDLRAIAPVLDGIANDTSVMNVSRARATRLLTLAGK